VKAGTVASFGFADLTDGKYSRVFNLSTNQWAASGGAPEFTNYTVTPNVDGWFLVSAIYTPTGATGGKNIAFLFGSSVVGQTVSFDTPQLEAGSFPTSYIPTATGTLARSADVCSITGGNFTGFYNSTAGTLLSEAMIANLVGDNRGIVQIDNGTNGSHLRHTYATLNGGFASLIRANTDAQTILSVVTGMGSTIQKRAIAYEGTSFASTTNGGTVATATRTMPVGLNAMRIGNLVDGSFYLSGHIAAIRYYKKRLPNAKLQALTV
jgi:hypothetical protein